MTMQKPQMTDRVMYLSMIIAKGTCALAVGTVCIARTSIVSVLNVLAKVE